MQPLPITGGSYKSESLPVSAQECLNWYVNIAQTNGLSQETLFGTPGVVELESSGIDTNRGAHVLAGVPYFVNGQVLYRLNRTITDSIESFELENIGAISGTGRVSMADNGTQLMILVPGGDGYIFTTDPDSLATISDPDFTANGNPQYVKFVDGYFLCTTDSKKFIVSALNDGANYNALDFGTAEADPDDIVAPIIFKNQVFIGGSQSIEGFSNIGGADFPFQRSGLYLDKGIASPFSVVSASDTFMFIGGGENESPAVWAFTDNTLVKISHTGIDSILQGLSDAELLEVFAWSYAQKGAYFVGFNLPNTTIVYDTITQRWHERKSRIVDFSGAASEIRFRVNSVVSAYGKVLVGDSQGGAIGSLDPDVYTEYGMTIIRRLATQPFQNNMSSIMIPRMELVVESGVGNDAVTDPSILMEFSRDGKTWSDGRSRRIGKIGEYGHRAIWRRNGRFPRFAVLRFTLTDAVKPVIIQLLADIVGGS